jgi:hypothetical protein
MSKHLQSQPRDNRGGKVITEGLIGLFYLIGTLSYRYVFCPLLFLDPI